MLVLCYALFHLVTQYARAAPLSHPTCPSEPSYVPTPSGRGTLILLSSVITLTLCDYTSIHLNITPEKKYFSIKISEKKFFGIRIPEKEHLGIPSIWIYKFCWVLIALVAPEIVLYAAYDQFRNALVRDLAIMRWIQGSKHLQKMELSPPNAGGDNQYDSISQQHQSDLSKVVASIDCSLNRFQLWIENVFSIHIAWWPLPAPRREISGGEELEQVWWKCKCGKRFIKWVLTTQAPAGQNTNSLSHPSPARINSPKVSTNSRSRGRDDSTSTQATDIAENSQWFSGSESSHFSSQAKDYVFLIAESPFKSRKVFGYIILPPPDSRCDGDFYRCLKKEYYSLRQWYYAIFTFRAFCYFKFVKFRQFQRGPIFCYTKEEIPSKDNTDYHTAAAHTGHPVPPPPIDTDLMNHYYNNPICADDNDDEHLKKIPKRVYRPLPNTEPICWGLQAVEGPSMLTIICVVLLSMGLRVGGYIDIQTIYC
ncbi:hypothetical protein BDD12DRAFT_804999 [Trichophaea hybrida]|nr:hypothetical protein BDD12DRAFT_804999 [Trichophaea hybrida]